MKQNNDINVIFKKIINEFESKNLEKFPYYETLIKDNSIKGFVEILGKEHYNNLLLEMRLDSLKKITNSSPIMKKLLKTTYENNKELFEKFMILNFNKDTCSNDFQEIGMKLKEMIINIENNLLKNVEGGKYSEYSGTLANKFNNYLKQFFPLYNNIGVKITKIKNI